MAPRSCLRPGPALTDKFRPTKLRRLAGSPPDRPYRPGRGIGPELRVSSWDQNAPTLHQLPASTR
jgi:hypothetical protein